nr:hypothetical protein [Tanacetum cinerariifolium]
MLLEGSELTKEDQESQLYDDFEHFKQNQGETIHAYYVWFAKLINDMQNIKMTISRMQLNSKFVNNMLLEWGRCVIAVKLNRGLRDSNNDQLVVVQNVQSRLNRGQRNNPWGGGAAGYGGAQNRVGNANPGQARQIKCYNCNGIGHITRNRTQPKHLQNSDYFKDKMLLMQAQENRVALDEEQLLFLVGGQYKSIDEYVDEKLVQDLALNVNNVFQADDCDAFDFEVDEVPTTQTMFMANLSSVDHVYDEAGPSYDSDILSENTVVDNSLTAELATYKEQVELYKRRAKFELTEREQKIDEQLRIVITDRNFKEEKFKKETSFCKIATCFYHNHNKLMVKEVTSLKKDFNQKENKYLEDFLDMKSLKEKVEDRLFKQDQSLQTVYMLCRPKPYYIELNKVAIGYKNPLCLTCAKPVQPALYNGHEIIKNNHFPAIVHNTEDTLEIAKITRRKINDKMKDPECVKHKVKIEPHDYLKENFLATFTPHKQLTPEKIFWSQDLIKMKTEALKEQTTASRPIKALMVYPPNIPPTLVPRVFPTKCQVKIHIFTLIQLFLEFDKTCKKRITPTRLTEGERGFEQTKECYLKEIEWKNLLIANDNLIVECLSKEVFYVATNYELNVARFAKMHVANTIIEARCLELEAELSNLLDKSHNDNHNKLVNRFSNLKHYIELYDFIKITRAKHIEQVTSLTTENVNLKAQILNNMNSVIKDHVKPIVLAPGVNHCTDASRSQPRSNIKKNRISPAKGVNKINVKNHPRTNKSHLRTSNRVDSSSRSKRAVINSNSNSICQTCNKCLISANHDMCVVDYLQSVVATPSIRNICNVVRKVKQVWKPKQVRQVWKPTEVFYVATNSELNVSRFTEIHVANTIGEARCLELKAELSNLRDKSHNDNNNDFGNNPPTPAKDTPDFDSVFVIGKMQASLQGKDNIIKQLKKQISHLQETCSEADRTLDFKALDFQITQLSKKITALQYAIDDKPIPSRLRNNREAHLDYLMHLKESVETIREIVEEAKVVRPLDSLIVSACRYTKHSQELLKYAIGTCPQDSNQ